MKTTKDELINSIKPNEANLDYIKSTHKINGSLLMHIQRIMDEYAKREAIELLKFIAKNEVYSHNDNCFTDNTEATFTSEQLYELFKQTHQ